MLLTVRWDLVDPDEPEIRTKGLSVFTSSVYTNSLWRRLKELYTKINLHGISYFVDRYGIWSYLYVTPLFTGRKLSLHEKVYIHYLLLSKVDLPVVFVHFDSCRCNNLIYIFSTGPNVLFCKTRDTLWSVHFMSSFMVYFFSSVNIGSLKCS